MCHREALRKNRTGYGNGRPDGHVTKAVSCCLDMALWSTLWMADQVSRMASGRVLLNFLAWSRSACGVEYERDEVDVWVSVEFAPFQLFWPCVLVGCWLLRPEPGCWRKEQQMATSMYVVTPF